MSLHVILQQCGWCPFLQPKDITSSCFSRHASLGIVLQLRAIRDGPKS